MLKSYIFTGALTIFFAIAALISVISDSIIAAACHGFSSGVWVSITLHNWFTRNIQ